MGRPVPEAVLLRPLFHHLGGDLAFRVDPVPLSFVKFPVAGGVTKMADQIAVASEELLRVGARHLAAVVDGHVRMKIELVAPPPEVLLNTFDCATFAFQMSALSTSWSILGAMPNPDYFDSLAGDAIDNHVGPNSSQFPHISIRTWPTSMRENCQIVGGLHQIIGHAHSGARIESGDVSGVLRQITQRAVSPNDKGQGLMVVDSGGGASNSPLASFLSHSRTISCGTTRPASTSAMPSSIARRLASSSIWSNMEAVFAMPVI